MDSEPKIHPLTDDALDRALQAAFSDGPSAAVPSAGSVLLGLRTRRGSSAAIRLREPPSSAPATSTLPSTPPADAEVLGRYSVLGEIARGGLGVILRGQDVDLGRDVALKVLHDKHADDPDMVRRLVEEAQIGGQLQHPGIVPVYEVGVRNERQPFFAMKLVSGETLAKLLKARTTPETDRRRFLAIFGQICQTVAYAHARGVIHRDLKPSNVMVGAFGEVQVVDWGLAKVVGTSEEPGRTQVGGGTGSSAGTVVGTWAYMPPEQARGEVHRVDARADVFALGSLLCEILTGEPAYANTSKEELREHARRGDLDDARRRLAASGADLELIALADRCLAVEPAARPEDASVVANAVEAHLAEIERRTRAAELGASEARAKTAEYRARAVAFGAALLLLLSAVGAYGWYDHQRRERIARTTQGVVDALDRAITSSSDARASTPADLLKWREAEAAVDEARALAATSGIDPSAAERLARVSREVTSAATEARASAAQSAKDARMARRIDEIRGIYDCADTTPERDRKYEEAFLAYGIDVFAGDADEVAKTIRGAAIATTLVDGLTDWISVLANRPDAGSEANLKSRAQLDRVVCAADLDTFRNRVRAAVNGRDAAELSALLKAPEVETASSMTLKLLATSALQLLHDVNLADQLHKTAVVRDPGSLDAHQAYFSFLNSYLPQRIADINRECEAALAVDPTNGHMWGHLCLNLLFQLHDPKAALVAACEAVKHNPESGKAYRNKGLVLRELGRKSEADAAFKEALARGPEKDGNWLEYGMTLREAGELERSRAALQRAVDESPGSIAALTQLENTCEEIGDIDAAVDCYRRVLKSNPDHVLVRRWLGDLLTNHGDPKGGAEEYRRMLAIEGPTRVGYNRLSLALKKMGDLDGAIVAVRQASSLDPNDEVARCNEVSFLSLAGRNAEALERIDAYLVIAPDSKQGRRLRGHILLRLDRSAEALELLEQAERDFPADVTVRNDLGSCLDVLGRLDEAMRELRAAVVLDPHDSEVHIAIAHVLQSQGDLDESGVEVREAARLGPGNWEAWGNLGNFLLGTLDLAGAIECYRHELELAPNRGYEALLGKALRLAGRPREALPLLEVDDPPNFLPQIPRERRDKLIAECRRMIELEAHLDDRDAPTDCSAEDFNLLARLHSARGESAAALRCYRAAFDRKPEPAMDDDDFPRYWAATAAVGAGELELGAEHLNLELNRLRNLREDNDTRRLRRTILDYWKRDPALSTVRDADELEKLPPEIQEKFRGLWRDVDALQQEIESGTRAPSSPTNK
jgi:serine/threonine-protein kinase